jgi:hypothetical protein
MEEPLKSLKTVRHLRQTITHATVLAACQLAAPVVWAATDPDPGLQAQLEARYKGDMSGVCVMAAVIEGTQVRRARYCALPEKAALPDWNAAFEIGSITKTMTAFLVSVLIAKGKWSLDDPIALHLPKGTQLPRQGERQILVRDLLTHSLDETYAARLGPSASSLCAVWAICFSHEKNIPTIAGQTRAPRLGWQFFGDLGSLGGLLLQGQC